MAGAVARFIALLVAAILLAAGCGGDSNSSSSGAERSAEPAVRDITDVLALRAAFNEDRGKPRLLLILSPT